VPATPAGGAREQDPYLLLVSGGVLGLMTIAFGLLGDGLRDLQQDRRRATGGRLRLPTPAAAAQDSAAPSGDAVLEVRDYSIAFANAESPGRAGPGRGPHGCAAP